MPYGYADRHQLHSGGSLTETTNTYTEMSASAAGHVCGMNFIRCMYGIRMVECVTSHV